MIPLIPAGTSHGQSLPVRVRRRRNAVAVEVHTRAANRARNQAAIRLFHALTMTFVYLSSILFCGCSLVYALLLLILPMKYGVYIQHSRYVWVIHHPSILSMQLYCFKIGNTYNILRFPGSYLGLPYIRST